MINHGDDDDEDDKDHEDHEDHDEEEEDHHNNQKKKSTLTMVAALLDIKQINGAYSSRQAWLITTWIYRSKLSPSDSDLDALRRLRPQILALWIACTQMMLRWMPKQGQRWSGC